MSRAWGGLALTVIALSGALAIWGQRPRTAPPALAPAPPAPLDTLTLVLREGAVSPEAAEFPLGDRLSLTLVNRGRNDTRIALAGYEHQFPEQWLRSGATLRETLSLDLPGEDFTWKLDGVPTGRLAVRGSHLLEGHR